MTSYPRTSSNESTIPGQADPRREIDEVIRDAEAVINGRSQGAPSESTDESVGSDAIERVSGLTQGLEDLAAEVADLEASMDRDPGAMDLTTGARTPRKSNTVATPTVSLVGMDQETNAKEMIDHEDASTATGRRLSELFSEKVQRGYGEIEQMVADAREPSFVGNAASDDVGSTGTPVDQARAAEQEAMAEIDAAIGHGIDASEPPPSQILRDTATTVDATLDGLVPIDDVPELEPAAMQAIDDVESTDPAPIDVVTEPPPTSAEETRATIEPTAPDEESSIESTIDVPFESDAADTPEVEAVSTEPSGAESRSDTGTSSESDSEVVETDLNVDRGVDAIEPEPPTVVEPQGSLGLRILTKPMRLLPASAQSLTTALAASLVVWVPIAWAWAVFASDPSAPTETSDPLNAAIVLDGATGPEGSNGADPTNASTRN